MVRTLHAPTARRRWPIAFGATLILLGLVQIALPPSWADMHYQGGFVQSHRSRDSLSGQPSVPTAPVLSYFPDNDGDYPSFSDRPAEASSSSPTRTQSYYFSPRRFPWNQAGFVDYNEPLRLPQDGTLTAPTRYALQAAALSSALPAVRPESALLIAYLPEHAVLWVDGTRTQSMGRTRYLESPPLQPGRKYSYTVRVAWIEDGRWVSQTRTVPVQARMAQAFYLRPR